MRTRVTGPMVAILATAWFIVAERAPARAEQETAVFVVPAVTVLPGETLTEEILVERKLFGNAIAKRSHFTSRDAVVGKVARRTLAAGAAIPTIAVGEARAFKEGERATLEFRDGGLSISAVGIALQPGFVGRPARVRNLDTGAIVTGTVREDGVVEVGGN